MDTIEQIKQKLMPIFIKERIEKAILFGSYAKGTQSSFSDLDLLIDSKGRLLNLDFFRVLDEISEILGIDIDLFEAAEIIPDSSMAKTIQSEGVVLYERKVA